MISLLIAGLSLVLSGVALWRQHTAEGRAHFTADWETSDSIVYVNHGPGAARDLRISVDGGGGEPIPYVGASQRMRATVVTPFGQAPPETFYVSWKDNRRTRQSVPIHLPDQPRQPPRRPPGPRKLEDEVRDIASEEAARQVAEGFRRITWGGRF